VRRIQRLILRLRSRRFPKQEISTCSMVGINGNGTFAALQQEIEDAMASMDLKKKTEVCPSPDLGRFRSLIGKESLLEEIELHKDNKFGVIDVKSVSFIKSDLCPGGAKYTRLAEFFLLNKNQK